MPYLFALLSIILLLPFVMYLNLGITKKGKLVIVALSLLMSVLGILAQMSYPLWQITLIMLILGFFLTYLLNNRFETLLFQINNENERNDYIEENFGYRNTILILDEEEEESETDNNTHLGNPTEDEIMKSTLDDGGEYSLHDEIPSIILEDGRYTNDIKEEKNDQDKIDILITSLQNQGEVETISNILVDEVEFSDTIEEIIKEGEEHSNSLKIVDKIENHDLELSDTILPIVEEELSMTMEKKEVFQIENLEDEIEELESIIFSSIAEEKTEELEIINFDEDEIVPIKEFSHIPKEEETKFKNKQLAKKGNYLSEIEKLLEED